MRAAQPEPQEGADCRPHGNERTLKERECHAAGVAWSAPGRGSVVRAGLLERRLVRLGRCLVTSR